MGPANPHEKRNEAPPSAGGEAPSGEAEATSQPGKDREKRQDGNQREEESCVEVERHDPASAGLVTGLAVGLRRPAARGVGGAVHSRRLPRAGGVS